MNYTPQGISKTSCKECLFAIYDNNTQIGCQDNRIDKFKNDIIEAYDNDKEFFVVNRLCTLYRSKDWNDGIVDINKAKEEIHITCDVLVDCNDIDDTMYNYLHSCLSKLSSKIFVKLFYQYNPSPETQNLTKKLFFDHPHLLMSIYVDRIEHIYLNVMQSSSMFHMILDKNNYNEFPYFIDKIDQYINEDLKKALVFKYANKIAISNLACRILYPRLYLDYNAEYPNIEQEIKNKDLYFEF